MIISASRRTDIPAFYAKWFMDKIRKGRCVYYNPFNKKGYEISLAPEDVDVIVFWSKNFEPMLPYLDELGAKYRLYFFYTITGMGKPLEKNVIHVDRTIRSFQKIAEKFGPNQIQWRFDPIVLTNITNEDFYVERFKYIISRLEGFTSRCYISFVNMYNKVERNFYELKKNHGIYLFRRNQHQQRDLANRLAEIAAEKGIQLYSCCNDFLVNKNIQKASCIDVNILNEVFGLDLSYKQTPTRKECGCYKSVDIGVYNTCPHGCVYCYANYDLKKAYENYRNHNEEYEFLVNMEIEVKKRLDKSKEFKQLSLF